MNRRSFLRAGTAGLLIPFAPAIVRASSLMPVKPVKPVEQQFFSMYLLSEFQKPQYIGSRQWITMDGVVVANTPDWLPDESPFFVYQGPA